MRKAIQTYVDGINRKISFIPGASENDNRILIKSFDKLSAAPAPDGNGFMAYYDIQLETTGNVGLAVNGFLKENGGRCHSRFIHAKKGVVWIPEPSGFNLLPIAPSSTD